jgi:UDP-N-acetylmuramoylalanine--D-glutamate ligase
MEFKSKKCLIIGLGSSGLSSALLLNRLGASVRISDKKDEVDLREPLKLLHSQGIRDVETSGHSIAILDNIELVVLSPGIRMDNPLVLEAKKRKIKIISEIELGYLCSKAKIIAITGTNGKTTTATLASELLDKAGLNNYLCGNIGKPFCDIAHKTKESDYVVLEVSSFQLVNTFDFKPHISMILNIDQDHLDYHGDLENYTSAKSRIFINQTPEDICILRKEDFLNYYQKYNLKAKLITVSENISADIYLNEEGHVIGFNKNLPSISEMNIANIKAIENYLFIAALAKTLNIDTETFNAAVNGFKGLSHRIESAGAYNGIEYIDDSKATNISATRQALKNLSQPIILIAGGQDKDTDFNNVDWSFLKNVKHIVLTGQARLKLKSALDAIKPVTVIKDFSEAIVFAKKIAQKGDTILLSPMCASFDEFANYKQRGKKFKKIVKEIN